MRKYRRYTTSYLGKSCSFGSLLIISRTLINFCVCPSFPFGFQSGMWNFIILIPDHWLSIYLTQAVILTNKYACPMSEISYNDI